MGKTKLWLPVPFAICLAAGIWLSGRPGIGPAVAEKQKAGQHDQRAVSEQH